MRLFGYDLGIIETLIALNVLVFIVTITAPNEIISNFGLQPASFLENPWTVVTSMFLHGSFDHILFNMMSLFFLGMYLENLIGENDLIKVYFTGGISASLLCIIVSYLGLVNPNILVIGASGAIFAVGATLAILRPKQPVLLFFVVPMPLYIAVFGFMVFLSFLPGISWAGHLGGLFSGIIFGYYFKKKESEQQIFVGKYGYRF